MIPIPIDIAGAMVAGTILLVLRTLCRPPPLHPAIALDALDRRRDALLGRRHDAFSRYHQRDIDDELEKIDAEEDRIVSGMMHAYDAEQREARRPARRWIGDPLGGGFERITVLDSPGPNEAEIENTLLDRDTRRGREIVALERQHGKQWWAIPCTTDGVHTSNECTGGDHTANRTNGKIV